MKERQHLEKQVEILQIALKESIDKVNEIKGIINMIKSLKGNLNDSKNFTKKIKSLRPVKDPVYDNRLITTCITCTHNCHDNWGCCDEQKYWCDAMINVGNTATIRCTVRKGKCSWKEHKNLPYIYKEEQYEKTITLNELKDM